MRLLILFGLPSVGKTTVGQIIESRSSYKLFHNHMVMDGVMHIFGVGSPSENRLSKVIRTEIIQEAADSGIDLIFTYVWNFGKAKGKQNIDTYKEIYEKRGGEVVFVELSAPLEVRVARANDPKRYRLKSHAPTPNDVATLEESLDMKSPSPFYYPESYTKIDTTDKKPEEIAEEIMNILEGGHK